MFYDPRTGQHGLPHSPWLGCVTPRPIGWISSLSRDSVRNLAPYSFFNAIADTPPMVMFSSNPRKDSQDNAELSGEFVVNIATWELREAMNRSSAPYGPEVDEFEAANLTPAPCRNVSAPRVAESPIAIECQYYDTIKLKPRSGVECYSSVIMGEVVGVHIDERILVDGIINVTKYNPLARLGYLDYTVVNSFFTMPRPVLDKDGS